MRDCHLPVWPCTRSNNWDREWFSNHVATSYTYILQPVHQVDINHSMLFSCKFIIWESKLWEMRLVNIFCCLSCHYFSGINKCRFNAVCSFCTLSKHMIETLHIDKVHILCASQVKFENLCFCSNTSALWNFFLDESESVFLYFSTDPIVG